MSDVRFCERAEEWLNEAERAALTGWTRRITSALAHLADAWTIADHTNAPRAVAAIAAIITASRSEGQRISWRYFVESCAGGNHASGGRGTELLAAVDEYFMATLGGHGARRGAP